MKSLVIHPDDRSTDMLRPIYRDLDDCTVVVEHGDRARLLDMVRASDFVFMLGHGCGGGLFSIGKFPGGMAVDEDFVPALREKGQNLCGVWCYADQFFTRNTLAGFYTGMIVSEPGEAVLCGLPYTTEQIYQSNARLSSTIRRHIFQSPPDMAKAVRRDYATSDDAVTAFNAQRIFGKRAVHAETGGNRARRA